MTICMTQVCVCHGPENTGRVKSEAGVVSFQTASLIMYSKEKEDKKPLSVSIHIYTSMMYLRCSFFRDLRVSRPIDRLQEAAPPKSTTLETTHISPLDS